MISIELLSPARNLACGLAAIDHGADAVYIGASHYGARAAAGNSVDDIATLCQYAHSFGARVYVTVNTILYDNELEPVRQLVLQLYEVGVDALIVQDMSLLQMDLPPIPLHASTQMDNRDAAHVRWLRDMNFGQTVLARECSLDDIAAIHEAVPDMPLEVFVHGALCVSYSGRCQASQICFGRSANRGECAQFCRLPFDLEDADGNTVVRRKHLLSLRDMDRHRHLEALMDVGVRSFKIEGRLKDEAYVRNITAFYRKQIDAVLKHRPEYARASWGRVELDFEPDPERSFSRGFTDYFMKGRTAGMSSPDTPKSRGKCVGTVKDVRRGCIVVAGTAAFANGDGLCYMNRNGELEGFRVNRAEGNHLYPAIMPDIPLHASLYRSADIQWERMMARPTARRAMGLKWTLAETTDGFCLQAVREDGQTASQTFTHLHAEALSDQRDQIALILGKLGDTHYYSQGVDTAFTREWFVPRSLLAEWRRQVVAWLDAHPPVRSARQSHLSPRPAPEGVQAFNVSNRQAHAFYTQAGFNHIAPAVEVSMPAGQQTLMTCRFCLRHELGHCLRQEAPGRQRLSEPLYLRLADGRRFRLVFDCRKCQMSVVYEG